LFQLIDKSIFKIITHKDTAKQMWDSMKVKYQDSARVKRVQLQWLRRIFETLEMKLGELVNDHFGRVLETANKMPNYGEDMNDVKIVEKILRSLTDNFNFIVSSIEESEDIYQLIVDELWGYLLVDEWKLRGKRSDEQVLQVEEGTCYANGRRRNNFQRGRGSSVRGSRRAKTFVNRNAIICLWYHKQGHY